MRLIVAVAALWLAGCAPAFDVAGREWAKPGTSIPQVTLDETNCARNAYAAGWTPDLVLGGVLDVGRIVVQNSAQTSTYRQCMRQRGYASKDG
jgi:hypothetical protein